LLRNSVISSASHTVTTLDWRNLRQIAEFDPAIYR
jgi:hypothetical protein